MSCYLSGSLGAQQRFRAALPDRDAAHVAVWIDLVGFADWVAPPAKATGEALPRDVKRAQNETARLLRSLGAVGLTAVVDDGSATWRVRFTGR